MHKKAKYPWSDQFEAMLKLKSQNGQITWTVVALTGIYIIHLYVFQANSSLGVQMQDYSGLFQQ